MEQTALERIVRRDRTVTLVSLLVIANLAWLWLLNAAYGTGGMAMMAAPANWTPAHALAMFVMWTVMMVGMMLPAAAPAILLYGLLVRRQAARGHALAPVAMFAAGYLIAWTAFSAAATSAQWGLEAAGLLLPVMRTNSSWLAGGLLVAAGIYQWTPWKHACLNHCRQPMEFLSRTLRPGAAGALRAGIHHGLYCIGCCWVLMLILFAGGVMNLALVAAIACFILIEKISPLGVAVGVIAGGMAIVAGTGMIAFGG